MIGLRAYAFPAGIAVLALMLLTLQWALHRAERAERRQAEAEAREVVAVAQGSLNQTAGEAVAHAQTREVQIIREVEVRAAEVAAAPGGTDPVPPGVLDSWRAALTELRSAP